MGLVGLGSRDGDLQAGDMTAASILHLIPVPQIAVAGSTFQLPRRLEMSVSELGVIGRRVSFVDGRRVLGQGIIGWN